MRVSAYFPAVASVAMLLLAAFIKWPYSFYILLRIVVCLSAVYSAVAANELRRMAWTWVMAGIAIVFNPVLPLHMRRSDWKMFNLIGATVFVAWIVVISLEIQKQTKTKI